MRKDQLMDASNNASGIETPCVDLASGGPLNQVVAIHSHQSVHVSALQEEEPDQPSQRGLVDQHQHSHAETIDERYEDLEIEVIRHFTSIPDSMDKPSLGMVMTVAMVSPPIPSPSRLR